MKQIDLDCSGDERRIVKHADIKLYEVRPIFWPLFGRRYYIAAHITGLTNNTLDEYSSRKPEWAVTSCIHRVIMADATL
jgi:hypothetical protein